MSSRNRCLLACALIAVSGPAAASDFRGFFSMFMGGPFLVFVILLAGALYLRRLPHTPARRGLALAVAITAAFPAVVCLGWIVLFAHMALAYSWIPVVPAFGWLAWRLWCRPGGRLATGITWLLLVLTLGAGAVIALDMSHMLRRGDPTLVLILIVMAALLVGAVALCVMVLRPPRPHREAQHSQLGAPGWGTRVQRRLLALPTGLGPAVVLLAVAAYGVYTVLHKLRV